ncbi:LysR family transcriptional regulator [Caballeronia sp. LZ034LL]|uniref:LysR family transcriptional regulator n=1 Tax=Caballeronia sp. LZ034LL TaxID=3038567 RepID=UPI00285BF038|nr:LysR family transcriptional regulator [Caballeronia sp. LZ034LL]MDR5839031.1 LysR family transcriptional regulator [Caballeronia sp. LZ034LL]
MQAFVEAVKQRSLGGAAQHLGISRTLVSRHIQALEDELGVRLMNRTTRSLSLTEAGQSYYHFCDDILTRVEEMDRQVSSEAAEARGEISVLAPKWLQAPITHLLTAFAKRHTEIRPRLVLGGVAQTAYGFLEQGCDIALHTRPIPDSRIIARRIADIPYCLCGSADYLATAAPLMHPADLAKHPALVHFAYHTWQFEQDGREERFQPTPAFSTNTFSALRDAALDSLGLSLLPVPLVRDDLAQGRLRAVLPEWTPFGQTLYVAIAPGSGVPAKVTLLMNFVVEWFGKHPL